MKIHNGELTFSQVKKLVSDPDSLKAALEKKIENDYSNENNVSSFKDNLSSKLLPKFISKNVCIINDDSLEDIELNKTTSKILKKANNNFNLKYIKNNELDINGYAEDSLDDVVIDNKDKVKNVNILKKICRSEDNVNKNDINYNNNNEHKKLTPTKLNSNKSLLSKSSKMNNDNNYNNINNYPTESLLKSINVKTISNNDINTETSLESSSFIDSDNEIEKCHELNKKKLKLKSLIESLIFVKLNATSNTGVKVLVSKLNEINILIDNIKNEENMYNVRN